MSDPTSLPTAARPAEPAPQPNPLFGRVLDIVDRVVETGRAKTLAVQRAARVARKLPALLFGVTLAAFGLAFLTLAGLRGAVEVTGAIFDEPKAWVAWLVVGGILLLISVFLGTVRNKARGETG